MILHVFPIVSLNIRFNLDKTKWYGCQMYVKYTSKFLHFVSNQILKKQKVFMLYKKQL